MLKETLLSNIEDVEKIATASKLGRMLRHPSKYIEAILFRELKYKKSQVEKAVNCKTFFGTEMQLLLPSSTDIYLTGGKTHDSEIRLARLIIRTLGANDTFIDVGAHYGYFSLLASKIVGNNGHVISFEAAPKTYNILDKNCSDLNNITTYHNAVSDSSEVLSFYEFPNMYSEYNTLDVTQFENEGWYQKSRPKKIDVQSVILDDILSQKTLTPKIIKIDVEGAELKVINGMKRHIQEYQPIIVMEYLSDDRSNNIHIQAERYLLSESYTPHLIDKSGYLTKANNISQYLSVNNMESDNVVFIKS